LPPDRPPPPPPQDSTSLVFTPCIPPPVLFRTTKRCTPPPPVVFNILGIHAIPPTGTVQDDEALHAGDCDAAGASSVPRLALYFSRAPIGVERGALARLLAPALPSGASAAIDPAHERWREVCKGSRRAVL